MDVTNIAVGISFLLGMGGICGAIWTMMRLNDTVKNRGKEEQRVMDKLEFLVRARAEDRVILTELSTTVQEFKTENQAQHHELEIKFTSQYHDVDKRLQQLELSGCQPAKK